MKYRVKTMFVFSGVFVIEADNAEEAKGSVEQHCGLVMGGKVHTTLNEEDCDWDFEHHPEKIIGRARKMSKKEFTSWKNEF